MKVANSITGPVAYAISIIGLVGALGGLIFSPGDMGAITRTLLYVVMIISLILAAVQVISSLFGVGASLAALHAHALVPWALG